MSPIQALALQAGALLTVLTGQVALARRGRPMVAVVFMATTDVPVALPDTQLGVGISARTRAGRDTLLSILAAIRFIGREQAR